jgi:hypothetical protein
MTLVIIISGAILVILDMLFTIKRYKELNKPLEHITLNINQISPFYNEMHKRYLKYDQLPKELFRNIKMGLKALDYSSPIEKVIDVFAKILFTSVFTVMTLTLSISIASIGIFSNDELKVNNPKWFDTMRQTLSTFKKYIEGYDSMLIGAFIVTLIAISHFLLTHLRNSFLTEHLVVIEEIEKNRSQNP